MMIQESKKGTRKLGGSRAKINEESSLLSTPSKQKRNDSKEAEIEEFSNELHTPQKNVTQKLSAIDSDIEAETLVLDSKESIHDVSKTSKTIVSRKVEKAYAIVKKMTGALGGNGYNGAIYGELTMHSMQKIVDILINNCSFDHHSRFIDVGAGLGKPNFHVAQYPGVRLSIGVELEEIRWQLSMHNLLKFSEFVTESTNMSSNSRQRSGQAIEDNQLYGGVNFILSDIDRAHSMDPFTHIYMYDLGFPPPLQQSIAKKFNNSVHAQFLVSYRPPKRVIEEYGYDVSFVEKIITNMHGSGEGHTAYFYRRSQSPSRSRIVLPRQRKLVLPKRQNFVPYRLSQSETAAVSQSNSLSSSSSKAGVDETKESTTHDEEEDEEVEETVHCDEVFYEAASLAVGAVQQLRETARQAVQQHLAAGRPRRTRRTPVV